MKQILRDSISLTLCFGLLACGGSSSKSKGPTPIAPKTGTTIISGPGTTPLSPTVTPSRAPETPTSLPTTTGLGAALADVPVVGAEHTLEIGTWNIENYPKTSGSKAMVSKILNQLDVDVMAVEEISGVPAFHELIAEMPKFTGILASEGNGSKESQNVGFIYRKSDFKLVESEALFQKEEFAFPRPPLMIRLDPIQDGRPDIVAIAVHLKAFGDDTSQQRREIANVRLEQYVFELKAKEPNLQIVILGDFNQPLLETAERKVFNPWFDRAGSYSVRTDPLVLKGDYSYFSGRYSLIDHLITTSDFPLGEPIIVKLQNIIPHFEANASDHLPVISSLNHP